MRCRMLLPGALAAVLGMIVGARAQQLPAPAPHTVSIDWNQVERVSKSTPALQVVVNPMLVLSYRPTFVGALSGAAPRRTFCVPL